MGSSVQIVPYNPALHAASLLRLYEEAFVAPMGAAAGVDNAASSVLEQVRTSSGFVGVAAGVGVVAGISVFDHPTRKDTCIIANLVTDVRYQRRGIASALLREVMRWVRQRRVTQVALQVDATNEAAIGLYQSMGFERVGEVAYLKLDSAALSAVAVPSRFKVRRATAADSPRLARLTQINIPRSLELAEPGITHTSDGADGWLVEQAGQPVGALCRRPVEHAIEVMLLLEPRSSPNEGIATALMIGAWKGGAWSSAASIVAKQSTHALMTVRELRALGFVTAKTMLHLARPLSLQ